MVEDERVAQPLAKDGPEEAHQERDLQAGRATVWLARFDEGTRAADSSTGTGRTNA